MSEITTNPLRESSGSVEGAAKAFLGHIAPQESEPKNDDQPVNEPGEDSNVENQTEATEEMVEETEEVQPEATEEEAESSEEDTEESVEDTFLIGDEEVTASQIMEWKSKGLMESDYRQKTQALAEQRKTAEAEIQAEKEQLRAEYEQKLAQYADVAINELKEFESVNWDQLRAEDPYAYQQKWVDYQRAQTAAQRASADIQAEIQTTQQEQEAARQERLAIAAVKVKELVPELGDPSKAAGLMSEMTDYLKSAGMTDEAIASIEDPVAYKVINDALQFSKINQTVKTAGKKKVSPVTKVVKSGSTASKATVVERDNKARQQKMNRLKESGSYKDAADIFRDMLN